MKYEPFKDHPEKHRLFVLAERWTTASQFSCLFYVILSIMVTLSLDGKRPYAVAGLIVCLITFIVSECFSRYYANRCDQCSLEDEP